MSGADLAMGLLAGFRALVDDVHDELARHGYRDLRPVHGFALQAVGPDGTTVGDLASRLGVSKQAAGKTVDGLVGLGLVERTGDPRDARRKIVTLAPAGRAVLRLSARAFERARADRVRRLGPDRMRELEAALREIAPDRSLRFDSRAWFDEPRRH